MAGRHWSLLLVFCHFATHAAAMTMRSHANPIRKVVTILQNMASKVEEEGKAEQELFDKFMCYCQTNSKNLENAIADDKARIPDLESTIEASTSKKAQLDKDLENHKANRAAAHKAMAEATAIRTDDKKQFDEEEAETKADLTAMSKAVAALEAGYSSSASFLSTFLQAGVTKRLQTIAKGEDMMEDDREVLLSFLSDAAQHRAPPGGTHEIIGILKEMHEEMSKNYADLVNSETDAVQSHETLMAAKKKEIKAGTGMIEEKLQRVSLLAKEVATMENELEDTKEQLAGDEKVLAALKQECKAKDVAHQESKACRQQELVTLRSTVKVLNDDDALELFKKTLPSSGAASFLQIPVTEHAMREDALQVLRNSKHNHAQVDFIVLALRGRKTGFNGVIKMINELTETLKEEQNADAKKKAYCLKEFDKAGDKSKSLQRALGTGISVAGKTFEDISSLKEHIEKLTAGIKQLDKSVDEATEQRKEEHKEFSEMMASHSTAKELIRFAENRLNKFYNPKLHKAAPERELSREDAIYEAQGGTIPTTAPGGIAGTGIGESFLQVSAAAETQKCGLGNDGDASAMAMMNILVQALETEMTTAEATEQDAQEDYEQAMKDSAEKRATDSKALAASESALADLQQDSEENAASEKSTKKELGATKEYTKSLHSECDWLLQNFDARVKARAAEADSLSNAKAVLSGADYS